MNGGLQLGKLQNAFLVCTAFTLAAAREVQPVDTTAAVSPDSAKHDTQLNQQARAHGHNGREEKATKNPILLMFDKINLCPDSRLGSSHTEWVAWVVYPILLANTTGECTSYWAGALLDPLAKQHG